MFNHEIEQIKLASEITIILRRGSYHGYTVADGSALTAVTGKRSFEPEEHDIVLAACSSKWGVGLCEIIK